jgi:hypothetical protein
VLTWSGLRGAVGLAMAIVADEADYTSAAAGRQIVFFAGGVAFLTVLVNGSSTHLLMRALGMLKPTEAEAILHGYVDATVKRRTVEAYESLAEVRADDSWPRIPQEPGFLLRKDERGAARSLQQDCDEVFPSFAAEPTTCLWTDGIALGSPATATSLRTRGYERLPARTKGRGGCRPYILSADPLTDRSERRRRRWRSTTRSSSVARAPCCAALHRRRRCGATATATV